MTELRKCPFCGGEAIIVYEATRKNVYGETIKGTAIGCRNCECQMFYRNRELAIEAWNKRVSCNTCAMYFPDDGCMAGLTDGEVAE